MMKNISLKSATIFSAMSAILLLTTPAITAQVGTPDSAPSTQALLTFTDTRTVVQDLARIDASLNNTSSFSGKFTQFGADGGTSTGAIFIRRPGKLRFEYDAPNPLLVVSDGVTLAQQDRRLETTDRVPLSATPLNYFLKENVNLAQDTEVVGLVKDENLIWVTARDGSGEIDGDITLVFDAKTLAMQGWEIRDSFGGVTRIRLHDLSYNERIDPRNFILRDEERRDRRRR